MAKSCPVGEEPLHRPAGALWNGEAQLARGCHRLRGRVAVRERLRLFPYVEELIDHGTEWAVFQPNEEPLSELNTH